MAFTTPAHATGIGSPIRLTPGPIPTPSTPPDSGTHSYLPLILFIGIIYYAFKED